jgi:hypothetical protein
MRAGELPRSNELDRIHTRRESRYGMRRLG